MTFSESNTVEQMILDTCVANAWQSARPITEIGS